MQRAGIAANNMARANACDCSYSFSAAPSDSHFVVRPIMNSSTIPPSPSVARGTWRGAWRGAWRCCHLGDAEREGEETAVDGEEGGAGKR